MIQEDIRPFFRPISSDMQLSDADYAQARMCVAMADAMARSTNRSLYVIDYHRKNFLYVSPNPLFLCGCTPEEVCEKGYGFYFEVVPPEEIQMLLEINEAGFGFYYRQPVEQRLGYIISYDFHIRTSAGYTRLIHHQLAPVCLSAQGDLWLALCTVSLSQADKAGNVVISHKSEPYHHRYSFEGKRWIEEANIQLTDRERDILQLSVQGLSVAEIGERLFINADTVKFHRKKLFQKLEAENITEAIGIASNLRLI